MNLVYCIDSIRGIGGIQHVTITKANALANLENNSVWIIYADHSGQLNYPLSPKVNIVDLGINYYEDDWKSRWKVLKGILIKRKKHRIALKKVLTEIRPDVVIAVGQSEKNPDENSITADPGPDLPDPEPGGDPTKEYDR